MKKTLYLFLSLLLCFALFACTQEPSATPNEVETATPEVTPNEVETVTPNEPEVVTPNEPEVPAEPETPIEPEVPTEPEENVIVLPEADENTKYITIDFPADFPEDPYAELNLVSPEEFEWGDYVPFIATLDEGALKPPVYSIISSVSPTLDEGVELYTKLNNKYLEIYNGEKLPDWYGKEMTDALSDYLYKSRVVYISPEADIIGRFNLIPKNNYPSKERWSGQYDIFLNGEIDHSFFHNNILDHMTTGSFYDYITPIKLYFRNKAVDNVTIDSNFTYRYRSKTVYPYYFCEGVKRDAVYFNEKNYTEDGVIFTDRYTLLLLSQDKSRITHIINYDHLKEENGIYCTSIELYSSLISPEVRIEVRNSSKTKG